MTTLTMFLFTTASFAAIVAVSLGLLKFRMFQAAVSVSAAVSAATAAAGLGLLLG